jgi:hypothetical protein
MILKGLLHGRRSYRRELLRGKRHVPAGEAPVPVVGASREFEALCVIIERNTTSALR